MASDLVLNGTTYDGTPATSGHKWKPTKITFKDPKVGVVLEAASGKRRYVHRGLKRTWEITWDIADASTRGAVRTLAALTTTWSFTDQLGVSYTVQTEPGDYSEEYKRTDPSGNLYYALKLTVREG